MVCVTVHSRRTFRLFPVWGYYKINIWPPHAKSWLIGKDSDAGRDWGAGGEGDDRGWDGWMASLTRWTWVWVNSGSWWGTGRPGVLWFMGSQRVGHDWATDLIWSDGFLSEHEFSFLSDKCLRIWLRGLLVNMYFVLQKLWNYVPATVSKRSSSSPFLSAFVVILGGSDSRVCLQSGRPRFNPWVGKISWRREWLPTPVFLPGEFHGERSLAGYCPRDQKDWDTTEQLTPSFFFIFIYTINVGWIVSP